VGCLLFCGILIDFFFLYNEFISFNFCVNNSEPTVIGKQLN
jgi:hypothetical protein